MNFELGFNIIIVEIIADTNTTVEVITLLPIIQPLSLWFIRVLWECSKTELIQFFRSFLVLNSGNKFFFPKSVYVTELNIVSKQSQTQSNQNKTEQTKYQSRIKQPIRAILSPSKNFFCTETSVQKNYHSSKPVSDPVSTLPEKVTQITSSIYYLYSPSYIAPQI